MKRMVIENTKYLTLVHGIKGHDPPSYNNDMKRMALKIPNTYDSKTQDPPIYDNDMKHMTFENPNT